MHPMLRRPLADNETRLSIATIILATVFQILVMGSILSGLPL